MIFTTAQRTKCFVNSNNWSIMLLSAVFIVIVSVKDTSCVLVDKQQQIFSKQNQQNVDLPTSEQNVMPFEQIKYSVADVLNNYNSSTKYNARGMGHLYMITRYVMNFVLPGEVYPEGFVYIKNGKIELADLQSEWRTLLNHYGLMLVVIVASLLFIVIMPFAGLLFCCCRCAGRCGSRSQPFEKRYDPCRRHTHGFFLSSITIFIMFGVVCAYVTNEYLENGVQSLPKDVRTSLRDTELYLNNTKKEVNNLLITNFDELDTTLNKILHRGGEIIKDKLGEISQAEVISNLTSIVSGLTIIRNDLSNIDHLTVKLKDKASELEQALKETRENLVEKLMLCKSHQPCMDFLRNYNITHLSLEADFTQLPNVTASLQNVSALLESDIESEVSKGKEEFEQIRIYIQKTVDQSIPQISNTIKKVGNAIKTGAQNITKVLDEVRDSLNDHSSHRVDIGESYLKEYGHYRYYVGLGVSSTLMVVLTCLTFGLFCGYCGKRPDGGYNDDCCDKGTGARFLMLGVWVIFLTSAGLMVITLVYFVTGVLAERAICQPLRHPGDTRIFAMIDELVHLEEKYAQQPGLKTLKVSDIIRSCHRNESIYSVLNLENVINITQLSNYPRQYGITQRINELTTRIKLDREVDILTPSAKAQLLRLANSPLNEFNFSVYTSVLSEKITSIDLIQLAAALSDTANKLPPSEKEMKNSLVFQAQYLRLHQQNQVAEMKKLSQDLDANARNLTEHLRFKEPSLRLAVEKMLEQVEKAQIFLNEKGPEIVSKIAGDFGVEFTSHIVNYLDHVISQTQHDVGKCWPISLVYNATVVSGCNKILDPYNGFWASVGFILVLFIPALILSVKLAALYQKSDPYPGPLVEAEYLYDAYADRDNIPLANVNEKKKKKHRSYHESYDNAGGGGGGSGAAGADYSGHLGRGERSRGGPPGSSDQRHWDFPNGGPPRYHSPPLSTEYERPPPYYYPGPAPTNRP